MLTVLTLGLACKAPEPPSRDLDQLTHWFWTEWEAGSDGDMLAARDELRGLLADQDLDEGMEAEPSRLTASEIEHLDPKPGGDPAQARGLMIAYRYTCTLDQLMPILYDLDQDQLYEGVYDAYSREYTSSIDDFASGASSTVTWISDITSSPVGSTYTEQIHGGLRLVPGDEPVLLGRVWMPEPAVFESGNDYFDQDYQLEVWYEDGEQVVHTYALWRVMSVSGLDMDNDGFVSISLGNMFDWDDATEELCASGAP